MKSCGGSAHTGQIGWLQATACCGRVWVNGRVGECERMIVNMEHLSESHVLQLARIQIPNEAICSSMAEGLQPSGPRMNSLHELMLLCKFVRRQNTASNGHATRI